MSAGSDEVTVVTTLAVHDFTLAAGATTGADGSAAGTADAGELGLRFAGALAFSDSGTLFVGDNHGGAIHAFEVPGEAPAAPETPTSIRNIDAKIAELLGVGVGAIEINDVAVHPVSREVFISATRIGSFASQPAIVVVSPERTLRLLNLADLPHQQQQLAEMPPGDVGMQVRGTGGMPLPRDIAKGGVSMRSLAIMDIECYGDELFVAGVAYDNFQSTLRRMAYPFDGAQGLTSVEMYHIAHDRYESRAPIRAMSVQEVDGQPQLVAAYTCSPVVLVPLEDLQDGAKISARTIIDMGNGQPLDMVPFELEGEPMLFVTSNGRSPRVIPVKGLSGAQVVTHEDFERGGKLDLHEVMPFGPAGKSVMFEGTPLHMALLDDRFFVAITRDAYTGDLSLDVNPTFFPNRVHNLVAEMDIPVNG